MREQKKSAFRAIACALALAGWLAACGGGSSITTPPPAGGFTEASLQGQYAFSMSGVTAQCNVNLNCGAYLARVGSFTADGKGNITAAIEDVLVLGSGAATLVTFTNGAYSIQTNGRGVLTLQASDGSTLQLSLTMQSPQRGFLVETDLNNSSSGTFSLQTPADFSTSAVNQNYAFDVSGIALGATTSAPISTVGQIITDGSGNITGGLEDVNDGNAAGAVGPLAVGQGSYQLDSGTTGISFGRGTMTFGGHSYIFYIVNSTHLRLIETDALGGTIGEALQQTATIPTQNSAFTGSFVYQVGGSVTSGTPGPLGRVARYTANGNGGLGAIAYNSNSNGNTTQISSASNVSSASYAIDTANAGSGRGTFTFTPSGQSKSQCVFYMVSASQGFVQETSTGVVADGPLLSQAAGPFALPGTTVNYAFGWTGTVLNVSGVIPFDENYVGQYALSNTSGNNIAGVVDYTQLGLSAESFLSNVGITGALTIKGDGTAANSLRVVVAGSPSTTINFAAYLADPSTVLVLTTDSNRVTAGSTLQQAPD